MLSVGVGYPLAAAFSRTARTCRLSRLYALSCCATEAALASETGRYYDGCREFKPSRLAQDAELGRELWARSEQMTGLAG